MFPPNVERVLVLAGEGALLDVGGWAQPFRRADRGVDLLPYGTRGQYGAIGPGPERFTAATWVEHDICGEPMPFTDKEFDFVVCSHVLEDVRDPIHVCRELVRVAKAGYIEVPSREIESTWGVEGRYTGYYHHRWLVELQDGEFVFRHKSPALVGIPTVPPPSCPWSGLAEERRVTFLFWSRSFAFCEELQISGEKTKAEMAGFVERVAPPSRPRALLSALPRTTMEAGDRWRGCGAGRPSQIR
ncbi:MAG: class I SAM-dependent methyltransferase [Acidimicrobiales bacterium]